MKPRAPSYRKDLAVTSWTDILLYGGLGVFAVGVLTLIAWWILSDGGI